MANIEIQNSLGQKKKDTTLVIKYWQMSLVWHTLRVQCTYSEQDVKQNNTYHYV